MTHAVISGVLEQLRSILQTDQVNLLAGVPNESEKLNDTLVLIQGVLEDAEEKEVKNGAVKAWLERLTRILYDADDVLDDWKTEILSSQIQLLDDDNAPVSDKLWSCLFSLFSCLKSVVVRHDDSSKMIDINERLDRIVKDKALLDLNVSQSREEPRAVTSSFVDASEIYGRVDDIYSIVSMLLSETSYQDSHVPLISVVGTGGFGKTTLVQLILKDVLVTNNFEKLMWVCVSQPFNLERVAKSIIEEATGNVPNTVAWQALHKERQDPREEESVLDGLQPHTNLAVLKIEGYEGNNFPLWLSSINTYLPNLVKLDLRRCNRCSELPALGRLQNLEHLDLLFLRSVKRMGCEFYGLGSTDGTYTGGEDSVQSVVVFPKLHTLKIGNMEELEWHLPFRRGVEIFPKLRTLTVHGDFMKLPPGLGKLKSLEELKLLSMKFGGLKLFQIDDNVTLSAQDVAVFPVLKKLTLIHMPEWEEQGDEIKLPIRRDEEGFIMPCLQVLEISICPKLKVVPHYLFSPALRSLKIDNCPQLTGRQPCLPPLLEQLELEGDTGFLSKSILPLLISGIGSPDYNDTTNNENDYPNLHSFSITRSEESSLPQGFNQLTAIQTLEFWNCVFLDFTPEDLKHLPKLQLLRIEDCPILEERCRKRESWTTNSHIPKILLNWLDELIPE